MREIVTDMFPAVVLGDGFLPFAPQRGVPGGTFFCL